MLARNLFDSSHDESDAVHARLQQRAAADAAVTVTGDGLNLAPVGRAASFSIQSRDIETADVNVKVTGQRVGHDKNLPVSRYNFNSFRSNFLFFCVICAGVNQRSIPVQVQRAPAGVNVSFTATAVGEHAVDIQVKNQRLPGSPFR